MERPGIGDPGDEDRVVEFFGGARREICVRNDAAERETGVHGGFHVPVVEEDVLRLLVAEPVLAVITERIDPGQEPRGIGIGVERGVQVRDDLDRQALRHVTERVVAGEQVESRRACHVSVSVQACR